MKNIKVNADYESVLFKNKPLPKINESLEFLAFFLDERPVVTSKKYSHEYFRYIELLTDKAPHTVPEGRSENWWGSLENIELEKKLNSKEMSAEFNNDSFIISSVNELPDLSGKTLLAKNPYGMSGQNFSMVEEGRLENLEVMLKNGKVVLEPFFDRIHDFSHYIYPNGVRVCYENIVDKKFQYRGTIFRDYTKPVPESLSFYKKIETREWDSFSETLNEIIKLYATSEITTGFSVDSFIHREGNHLKIRALSEVNYRRTMGQVAFELSVKFGGVRRFSAFLLSKSSGINFSQMREKISSVGWRHDLSRGVIILSPGDVRYDMFFLSALNQEEGKVLLQELKSLLPDSELAIEF